MFLLLKLWGIAMLGIGAYCVYTLGNILFIKGMISSFSTFFIILSLLGILVGITLIWAGYRLLVLRKKQ